MSGTEKKMARCSWCGLVYDLLVVKPISKYTSYSTWDAPCCGARVDNLGESGLGLTRDYFVIDNDYRQRVTDGGPDGPVFSKRWL